MKEWRGRVRDKGNIGEKQVGRIWKRAGRGEHDKLKLNKKVPL